MLEAAIRQFDLFLRAAYGIGAPLTTTITTHQASCTMSAEQKKSSGALMRVNHSGEICAQALYQGQALTVRDEKVKAHLLQAAKEELDHLAWTATRLRELGSTPSVLAPVWFGGAFALGLASGLLPPALSLGFVTETERQVEAHLDEHLERLPESDQRSRSILLRMREDEIRHGADAEAAGGQPVPAPLRWAMSLMGKIMTRTAEKI